LGEIQEVCRRKAEEARELGVIVKLPWNGKRRIGLKHSRNGLLHLEHSLVVLEKLWQMVEKSA
jgi:hypothetical protein